MSFVSNHSGHSNISLSSSVDHSEAYTVRLIGAPLRRVPEESSAEAELEVLFEVRGGRHEPWRVQRGYSEIARMHRYLAEELPWAALPRLPEPKPVKTMARFFRSRSTANELEEKNLRELAEQLEEYLNTLLAIPGLGAHTILQLFLDVPEEVSPPQEEAASPTAAELGERAAERVHVGAENVAGALGGVCDACRAFCSALGRQTIVLEDQRDIPSGTSLTAVAEGQGPARTSSFDMSVNRAPGRDRTSSTGSNGALAASSGLLGSAEQLSRRKRSSDTSTGAREVIVPLQGNLEEWK